MSIDDTQYDIEAERKARQQEFKGDLSFLIGKVEDSVKIDDDEEPDYYELQELYSNFIKKWSPK